MRALLLLLALSCAGCSLVPFTRLKSGATAQAPKDVGTPATVEEGQTVTSLPVPAGSIVTAKPAEPATATEPAKPASVSVVLSAPSELRSETKLEKASTGSIDTTVATKRIEIETAASARAPLLYAAIAAAALAVVALIFKWPSVALLCGIAAVVFGISWKLAEVPWWIALIALVAGGALMLGYKRASWDTNKNGVPDILEPKS